MPQHSEPAWISAKEYKGKITETEHRTTGASEIKPTIWYLLILFIISVYLLILSVISDYLLLILIISDYLLLLFILSDYLLLPFIVSDVLLLTCKLLRTLNFRININCS